MKDIGNLLLVADTVFDDFCFPIALNHKNCEVTGIVSVSLFETWELESIILETAFSLSNSTIMKCYGKMKAYIINYSL